MKKVVHEFLSLKSDGDNIFLGPTEDKEFVDIIFQVFIGGYYVEPVSQLQINTYILNDILEQYTGEWMIDRVFTWLRNKYLTLRNKPIPLDDDVKNLFKAVLYFNGFVNVNYVYNPSEMRRVTTSHVRAIKAKDDNGDTVIFAPLHTYSSNGNNLTYHKQKGLLTDQMYISDIFIKDSSTVSASQIKEVLKAVDAMRWRTSSTIRDKGNMK